MGENPFTFEGLMTSRFSNCSVHVHENVFSPLSETFFRNNKKVSVRQHKTYASTGQLKRAYLGSPLTNE